MKMKKTVAAIAAMSLVVTNVATIPVMAADTDVDSTATTTSATTTAATEVDYSSAKSTVYNFKTPYSAITTTLNVASTGTKMAVNSDTKGIFVTADVSKSKDSDTGLYGFPDLASLLVDSYNRSAEALYDIDEVSITIKSGANTGTYTISSDVNSDNYNRDLEYLCTDLTLTEFNDALAKGFYCPFSELSSPVLKLGQAYTGTTLEVDSGSGLSKDMYALDSVSISIKVSAKTITSISTKAQNTYCTRINEVIDSANVKVTAGTNSSDYNFRASSSVYPTNSATDKSIYLYSATTKDKKTYIESTAETASTTTNLTKYLSGYTEAAKASLSPAGTAFDALYSADTGIRPLANLGTLTANDYQKSLNSVYNSLYDLIGNTVYAEKLDTADEAYTEAKTNYEAAKAVYGEGGSASSPTTGSLWAKYKAAVAAVANNDTTNLTADDIAALTSFYGSTVTGSFSAGSTTQSAAVTAITGSALSSGNAAYELFGAVQLSEDVATAINTTEIENLSNLAGAYKTWSDTNAASDVAALKTTYDNAKANATTYTYFGGKVSNSDAALLAPSTAKGSYTVADLFADLKSAGYISANKLKSSTTDAGGVTLEQYILNTIGAYKLDSHTTTNGSASFDGTSYTVEAGAGYTYYTVNSGKTVYSTISEFCSVIQNVASAKSAYETRLSEIDKLTTTSSEFKTWYSNNFETSSSSTYVVSGLKATTTNDSDSWSWSSVKSATTKTSLFGVDSEQWTSISGVYDWNTSSYYLAEILDTIGDNKGCQVKIHVDPLSLKRSDSTDVATVDSRDAAKLIREAASMRAAFRVNGSATNQFTKVYSYNTDESAFILDWDTLTGTKFSDTVLYARTLDILSSGSFGIDTITVIVPDQTQFATSTSTSTSTDGTTTDDEDKTIGAGDSDTPTFEDTERPSDDTDTITDSTTDDDDFWDEDGDAGWSDIDLGNSDVVTPVEDTTTTGTDASTSTTDNTTAADTNTVPVVDVTPTVVTPVDTVTTTTSTPSTGNAAPVVAGIAALASAAFAAYRKVRK